MLKHGKRCAKPFKKFEMSCASIITLLNILLFYGTHNSRNRIFALCIFKRLGKSPGPIYTQPVRGEPTSKNSTINNNIRPDKLMREIPA